MKKKFTFSQAVTGFLLASRARRLSESTIYGYNITFNRLVEFLEVDLEIDQITSTQINSFLAAQTFSKKNLLNYRTALSSLWTWAEKEKIVNENIIRYVERPRPEKKVIVEYSKDEIRKLLSFIDKTRTYFRPGKKKSNHALVEGLRNRTILFILLDTGMRVSELCNLKIKDFDPASLTFKLFGKGDKERLVPISNRTAQILWRYLATREKSGLNEPLIANRLGGKLSRGSVLKMFERLGRRANIQNVYPHRFRHTFAIEFLRNGGDIYTLQQILGHSTLDMVQNYLAIAETDIEAAHRKASPVDNWHL